MDTNTAYRLEIVGEGQINPSNDNVDVWVYTEDGSRYSATFFTVRNIETLMDRWRESGECAGGTYFWCIDAIIVRELSEATIRSTVDDLFANGEFYKAFGGPYEACRD